MSALMIQQINLLIARTVNDKTKLDPKYRGGQIDIVIKLAEITGFPLETLNKFITKKVICDNPCGPSDSLITNSPMLFKDNYRICKIHGCTDSKCNCKQR